MRYTLPNRIKRTNLQAERNYHLNKGIEKISNLHGNRKWFLEIKRLGYGIKYIPSKDSVYPDMKVLSHTFKHFRPLNDRPWYIRR